LTILKGIFRLQYLKYKNKNYLNNIFLDRDTFIINKDLIEKDNDTNKSYAEDTTISSFTSNGNS